MYRSDVTNVYGRDRNRVNHLDASNNSFKLIKSVILFRIVGEL